jgi:Alginate export
VADCGTAAGRSLRRITWLVLGSGSVLGAGVAGSTHAQSSQPSPPPLTTLRDDEDYASLRDPAARTGAWWEPLKYIPLNKTGDVYVTVGAELRLRYEGFENNTWGQEPAPDDGYLWYRALPVVDLHLGPHVRLFGQLIAAWAEGKEPAPSPVDETGVDLLQGFADVTLPLGHANASFTLRPGRQMLSYGSERLIGIRYGPNVLRTFDGVKGFLQAGGWRVDGFYARPVAPRRGAFDDEADDSISVWSLYATRGLPIGQGTGLDLYYIGYHNDAAAFNQGMGRERRHTVGARLFGQVQGWDWDGEAIYQFGEFADGHIGAWSVASSTGYTFANAPLKPRLGLKANIISGDNNLDGRDLQTFNPLFPKGKYFGELALLGPQNLISLHSTVDLQLGGGWSFNGAVVLYWRESTGDGIYDIGGNLIRGDGGSDARFIGTQAEVVLTYEHSRNLDAMLSYSQFYAGTYIKDTGPSKTVHFVAAELRFRF